MKKLLINLLSILCILSSVAQGQFVPISPQQFNDATFRVFDNADPTKRVAFQITDVATGTTRIMTIQNVNGTLVVDVTACNDLEGTGLSIAAGVLNWAANADNLGDVDTTGDEAPSRDQVLKWNGSNWVPAAYGYSFELTIASFTDNEATTQLIGSGVWETTGNITFDATYNNGPPDSASIAITSDDGSYTPWGTDPLVMDSPYAQKTTTENTNYPTVKDKYVRFTLTAMAGGDSPTDAETVTFRNYIWYGDPAKASSFTESDVEGETSILSNDQTRSVTINAGAGEYLMFAFPATYTSLPVGTDYETDGDNGTGFVFNGITCACIEDTTTLSITNSAGYTENYKVYASTTANLGNHTLTTYTSTTEINTLYWGVDSDSSASEAMIEALANSAASNTKNREFTVTAGASEYIWYCYPKRLGTSTFYVGGFEGGFESPETVDVTNFNGWSEDYYAYRSTNHSLGETTVTVTD
ncbi:hypothetical protein KAR91_41555 [Candidatus Pacearchaeota archaeon]|nr:hypothetical protein [Candidatus Pacearchaeota archaeon]